jgi:branched-chain amino acid transport system permease protein
VGSGGHVGAPFDDSRPAQQLSASPSACAIFALGYTLIFSISASSTSRRHLHARRLRLRARPTPSTGLRLPSLPLHLPVLALIGGSLFAAVCRVAVERLAFRPLRRGDAAHAGVELGVAVALVNVIQYLFGAEAYSYPADPFGHLPSAINFGFGAQPILVRTVQVIIFAVSMVVLAVLTVLMNATRTGKALRAVAEDTVTASLLGIDTDRLILLTFVISGFLGGVSGTLVGLSVGIAGPYFGIAFGLKGLAVIVLGGLGDIPGAVVGGLVIGLVESFVPSQYIAYREAVPFALLFVVLLLRPQGLLGRTQVQKV